MVLIVLLTQTRFGNWNFNFENYETSTKVSPFILLSFATGFPHTISNNLTLRRELILNNIGKLKGSHLYHVEVIKYTSLQLRCENGHLVK